MKRKSHKNLINGYRPYTWAMKHESATGNYYVFYISSSNKTTVINHKDNFKLHINSIVMAP